MPTLKIPRSRQVLCVDDDEDACEMLSLLLKSHRIDATCARSAAEAWLKIKAECFDLYLLDAWLPHLDGFEFCRQIREFDSQNANSFLFGRGLRGRQAEGDCSGRKCLRD